MKLDVLNRPKRWRYTDQDIVTIVKSDAAAPCRICGRAIEPGDHCLYRPWMGVTYACVTCCWWKFEEVTGQIDIGRGAFDRVMRVLARGGLIPIEDARTLIRMRICRRDPETNKLRWDEGGKRLADAWRAQNKEEISA